MAKLCVENWADESSDEELAKTPIPRQPTGAAEPLRVKKTVVTDSPDEPRKEHKKPTGAAEPHRVKKTVVTESPAARPPAPAGSRPRGSVVSPSGS